MDPAAGPVEREVPGRGDAAGGSQSAAPEASTSSSTKPTVIIVIGMAGSGKTTLIQRINSHLHAKKLPGYIINLDPAVMHVPYPANIDIRDTVKYKNVMKEYNLGPNGGILTSCNLFATRFDQVVQLLEKPRDPALKYVVIDTPGQIEIFTWSASGAIITELLASSFPTIVVYVIDTPRCASPQTFMSNMLQACSILYKTKLPMVLAFNKVDVVRHEFALQWMEDFESYHEALERDASYSATLSRSLSMVLDEFYTNLTTVGVSAVTGEGMDAFVEAVDKCAGEYHAYYVPEMERLRKEKADREAKRQQKDMEKLRKDMQGASFAEQGGATGSASAPTQGTPAGLGAGAAQGGGGRSAGPEAMEEGDDDDDGAASYRLSDESIEESGGEDEDG